MHKTYKTYKMMMGAPVFALTGYAAASHVIPRGFAVPQCGLARAINYLWGNTCIPLQFICESAAAPPKGKAA